MERTPKLMDCNIFIRIILGYIRFTMDKKIDSFIKCLIELFNGLFVAREPIIGFILPKSLIGAANE